jgi:DNA-binding NarL/FixJ family response regulator
MPSILPTTSSMEPASPRFVVRASARTLLGGALGALIQTLLPGAQVVYETTGDGELEGLTVHLDGSDRWILVGADPHSPSLAAAIVDGAWSVLLTDASGEEFERALRAMIDGSEPYLSRGVSTFLARQALDRRLRPRGKDKAGLTPRERQVIALISQGASNREVADRLVISENTVRTHLQAIYAKLEVQGRLKMLVRARELGLREAGDGPHGGI